MHPVTVYRLVKEEKLPVFRIGRMLRFDADELERWMLSGKVPMGRKRRLVQVQTSNNTDS